MCCSDKRCTQALNAALSDDGCTPLEAFSRCPRVYLRRTRTCSIKQQRMILFQTMLRLFCRLAAKCLLTTTPARSEAIECAWNFRAILTRLPPGLPIDLAVNSYRVESSSAKPSSRIPALRAPGSCSSPLAIEQRSCLASRGRSAWGGGSVEQEVIQRQEEE